MTEDDNEPTAPNQRSFSLNSDEAYDALATPRERPPVLSEAEGWIPNGALPREPRVWEREVVACPERSRGVEKRERKRK
jgi:hypothetical protein